ncbi:MAG: tRNA modification GTPase [Gemmataceae bacterium]
MTLDPQDTIVALSSAPGGAARAVVRLTGPQAFPLSRSCFVTPEAIDYQQRRLYVGEITLPDLPGWSADLYVWPGPKTYTGQDLVELHTLGSPPLIDRLIAHFLEAGARAARPGEFTLRAFLAGKLDLPRAEAVLAVIDAGDRAELGQALTQLAGGLTTPLHALRDDLLNLLADVEAGLDFSDEDLHFVEQRELLERLARGLAHVTLVQKQIEQRSLADRPFRVVLAGPPNAGKSSLFNALAAAEAALVSSQPGTTRDYLVRRLRLDDVVLELVDTAGQDDSTESIESVAQALGRAQASAADLVLWCQAADGPEVNPPAGAEIVATKCDLGDAFGGLATSALTGAGLEELKSMLRERARARPVAALAPSLSRCRHHVNACLAHLRQAHAVVLYAEPAELLALELRGALDQLGEMVGAIYTDDLLDRIFSRFCIGK